jgi:hypothetical protein
MALGNAASVIWQATASASKPFALRRVRLSSNGLGSTQLVVPLQLVTYVTGTSTNGTAATPTAKTKGISTAASTAWYVNSSTLGTTPTILWQDSWNTASFYDLLEANPDLQEEFPVSTVLALIVPSAPGAGITYASNIDYVEYG